jgi:hypothetical protein
MPVMVTPMLPTCNSCPKPHNYEIEAFLIENLSGTFLLDPPNSGFYHISQPTELANVRPLSVRTLAPRRREWSQNVQTAESGLSSRDLQELAVLLVFCSE